MSWAQPGWAAALLGVAGLAVLLWFTTIRHRRRLSAVFRGELLARVLPAGVRRRRVARDALAIAGLALVVAALAEPRFGKQLRDIKAEGVDLVLAVDVSRSMDATDVDPSRLERSRREILDLLKLLEGDRVGLVMYAGGAYPRMPLTLDYKALDLIVRELDTRVFQAQGSALGEALRQGRELLSTQQGDAGQAILVLSDGEIHEPGDALSAARELADAGISVYGMVVGTGPAPIPNGDGTFLTDPTTGERVLTVPSAGVLTDVARLTGGAVVQSVASAQDVEALYRDELRAKLRAAVSRTSQRETWQSAFHWPLGLGLLLLLAAAWLGDGRRQAALLAAALLAALPAQAQTVRDGDVAYQQQRYEEAVRIFTDLSLEHPEDPELFDRLGAARYRAGDHVGAARAWERVADLTGDPNANFNAGNAYYRSGQLDRAVQRYDDTLARKPQHTGALANKQLVEAELQERRQLQDEARQQQQDPQQQDPQQQDPQQQPQQDPQQQGQEGSQEGQRQPQGQPGQEGQQQEGQQAEQQPGQPQQPRESRPQGDPGDPQQQDGPRDDGTREQEGDDGQVSLDEVQPEGREGDAEPDDPTGAGNGPAAEPPVGPSGMTRDQASRVLDGVEEGRPRVYIPGERGEKPW